jgi:hypothetical protein
MDTDRQNFYPCSPRRREGPAQYLFNSLGDATLYSALMFAALMIGHHFSISAFWRARSASGVCCSRENLLS